MKYLPLVLRNLGRNPTRTLLTVAAVALAIALIALLRTLPDGMQRMLNEFASNTRIGVFSEAGMSYPLPYAHLRKVAALEGVEAVASWTWVGGTHDPDRGVRFPSFAIEAEGLAGVWPDWAIRPEARADFARHRNGAIVGVATMTREGWQVGDLVTLVSTALPLSLELQIVGTIDQPGMPLLFVRREYLDQALQAQGSSLDWAGTLWIRARDPLVVPALQREIEALFRHSEASAVAQTEKGYLGRVFGFLEDFLTLILVVTALVAVCVVFIASNTASLAIRERGGELAVLRAIGFPRRTLLGLLVAETTLLAAVAGVLGVGVALGLTGVLRASSFATRFPPLGAFTVDGEIVLASLGLALGLGVVTGLAPAVQAIRRAPAQMLRELD